MSRISFHSLDGTAEVYGSERAHFGCVVSDITWAIFRTYAEGSPPALNRIFPKDHYIHSCDNFPLSARIALSAYGLETIEVGEIKTDIFCMQLNTAISIGGDYLKLAARLHGQCEIHTYVKGSNRKWLANIIKEGAKSLFYRSGSGWDGVIDLLEKDDNSPVVTSYSVCESFPNSYVAKFPDDEAWYELPFSKQWEMALKGLSDSPGSIELNPNNWSDYYFGNGYTAFDIIEKL